MRSGGADLPAKALSIEQTCALVGSPLALSLSRADRGRGRGAGGAGGGRAGRAGSGRPSATPEGGAAARSRPRDVRWAGASVPPRRAFAVGWAAGEGAFGVKCRFGRTAGAATATCSSGCIYIGVVRALARVLTASIDVPVARYLPALISSSSLWATSYGLATSCHSPTGLTGCFHSRHTSTLSPVSLRRSSRAGSRPLTPCNVLAAAERRSALNLCKCTTFAHAQGAFPASISHSNGIHGG